MPETTWPGGYVRTDRNGRPIYVIRRMLRGRRYVVSTGRSTLAAAMRELARWEMDPESYGVDQRVILSAERVVAYLDSRRGKVSDRWLLQARGYLRWWAERLAGVDLRTLEPGAVERHLRDVPARQHRIATLRAVVSWLYRRGDLERDPLVGRLPVPQSEPAQWRRARTVTRAEWDRVTQACAEPWRSAMAVLGATGWHLSELARWTRTRTVEGDVLVVRHKSGREHRTRVDEETLAAANRLPATLRTDSLTHAVGAVADELGVKVRPGDARHCVATWAVEAGASMAEVATFLGHRDARTTARWYAARAVPARPKGL